MQYGGAAKNRYEVGDPSDENGRFGTILHSSCQPDNERRTLPCLTLGGPLSEITRFSRRQVGRVP